MNYNLLLYLSFVYCIYKHITAFRSNKPTTLRYQYFCFKKIIPNIIKSIYEDMDTEISNPQLTTI